MQCWNKHTFIYTWLGCERYWYNEETTSTLSFILGWGVRDTDTMRKQQAHFHLYLAGVWEILIQWGNNKHTFIYTWLGCERYWYNEETTSTLSFILGWGVRDTDTMRKQQAHFHLYLAGVWEILIQWGNNKHTFIYTWLGCERYWYNEETTSTLLFIF